LQQMGEAPVDDPLTEKNEALDFEAYSGLYVNVSGQQVLLRDIPLDARKSIRDKWAKNPRNSGVWLSAEKEALLWLEMKAEADKATEQKVKASRFQSVLPVPLTDEERQAAMRALAPKKQ
jgi:hypothetical protein